ncbi:MAG: L,D-transpeptidase family protein [Candidatus Pacebacteria bacterium]|nr:L,D-transpeptidase family protein [Candidatus Paceibacterota bacterium]
MTRITKTWLALAAGSAVMIAGIVLVIYFTSLPMLISPQGEIDPRSLDGQFDASQTMAVFNNRVVTVPTSLAPSNVGNDTTVLGESTTATEAAEKVIKIDLQGQRLFMIEDGEVVDYFMISSGKWGRTPTGEFTIWSKFRYTKMSGGSRALRTYYYLPNVPYVMFFANNAVAPSRGYSIHGTYWHDNFGTPMSHGCINMKTEHAEKVYHWAHPVIPEGVNSVRASKNNPGTKVIIYGEPVAW